MNVQKDLMADDARSATQNIRLYYITLDFIIGSPTDDNRA